MPRSVLLVPLVLMLLATAWSPPAAASDPCMRLSKGAADPRGRIAAVACEEHRLWYRPLIEADGRMGSVAVREAARHQLANGQPAWQRVVDYWRGSGLLWQAGAGECAQDPLAAPACRLFVLDTPWSAAFVSWVMQRAGLPGFGGSLSHLGYVRQAFREPFLSPYRVSDPETGVVGVGDLLCYVRGSNRVYGFNALARVLSGDEPGLGMHCDIVVGTSIRDQVVQAHLVGGNVSDAVTMRQLPLTPGGRFANLPKRTASDPDCTPESRSACDINRQDWAVLLQLRPDAELATLRGPGYVPAAAPASATPPAVTPTSTPAAVPPRE